MVHFTCENCNKVFDRKYNLERHLNSKKNPCKSIIDLESENNSERIQNIPKHSKIIPKTFQNIPNNSKKLEKIPDNFEKIEKLEIIENNKNICKFCFKNFSTGFNLNKHLKNSCKVKILEDEKKQNIFENLIQKDKKIDVIINRFEKMEENNKNLIENNKNLIEVNDSLKTQNEELKRKNEDLEKKINKILSKNTQNITNNTNTNNTNITNNIFVPYKINPFNEESFKKLDRKEILKIMTDTDNNGTFCFNKLIKMIHFNNKVPENQNIYMNDYNRGLYMIHDGNQWNLRKDEEFIIFSVLEHVRDLYNEYNDDELEEKLEKDLNFKKNFQTTFKKYFDYVYDEVEDKDLDEKELKKKKEFKMKMDKEVKNGLYNYRHIPQKSAELLENLCK